MIEIKEKVVIFENPIPNLVSRHAYFPGLTKISEGDIIALFSIGEAFESMNSRICISRSTDEGKTWNFEGAIFKDTFNNMGPCTLKPTLLDNNSIIAIGYGFYRDNPEVFINLKTGGLPKGVNVVSFSYNRGKSWTLPETIPLSRPGLFEISGPCIQLKDGDIIASGTSFPDWEGKYPSGKIGVILRSKDNGMSWDDNTIFFSSRDIVAYESRLCQMDDGRVLVMLWLYDEKNKRNLTNHIVVSYDNGFSWSEPIDTGIFGQASNLLHLDKNLLLSIHCFREKDVGLYLNIVEFKDSWNVIFSKKIWGNTEGREIKGLKDMGKSLKFGQPSIFPVKDNKEFLVVFWAVEDCISKILGYRVCIGV
ncbi:MAG: glycoside hydrolase [bacterium]|nr:glycoside hydrolase [bacterium]